MKSQSSATILWLITAISAAMAENPIMPGADPHAVVIDDTVWIYPTNSKGPGARFFAYESKNLSSWTEHGPVLDFKDLTWIHKDGRQQANAWAPCLIHHDGKYYFYYSVGPQSDQFPAHIGVATGDSPAGPFTDSGQALLTGGNGFEAIDPFVFHDEKNNRHLFFAGGSAGATLRVFILDPSLVRLDREIPTANPPKFTEGPFLHEHAGIYHLTYSHGGWRDASYSVHHATSTSPLGPWTYRGCILKSDARHKGPGHHSIIQKPGTNDWLIVYHRWNHSEGNGPYHGSRSIAIDRLEHGKNGTILPVVMTDDGIAKK